MKHVFLSYVHKDLDIVNSIRLFLEELGIEVWMDRTSLAAYTAEQKTKEIGIRKVLGASAFNIYILLSRDFFKWVTAANIVAWPVAYYGMQKWLQSFAFRTRIGWEVFLLSAIMALIISIFTISFLSIKAARANPVDSLRYE